MALPHARPIGIFLLLLVPTVLATHMDVEPNNTCATGTSWGTASSGSSTGTVSSTDTQDHTSIPVVHASEILRVTMTPPATSDFDMSVIRDCRFIAWEHQQGTGITEVYEKKRFETDDFGIRVAYISGPSGTYTVGIEIKPDDAGLGGDAGDSAATATTIASVFWDAALPNRVTVDEDWWKIHAMANAHHTFVMTTACGNNFDLAIYRADGSLIESSTVPGCSAEDVSCATVPFLGADVLLRVTSASGAGAYRIEHGIASFGPIPPIPPGPSCG